MRMMFLKTPYTKVRPQCTERLVIMRQEACSWTSPAHMSKQNPSGLPRKLATPAGLGSKALLGALGLAVPTVTEGF